MINGRGPIRAASRPKRRARSSTTSGPGDIARPARTMSHCHTVVRYVTLARNMAVNERPNAAVARLPQRKLAIRNSVRSSAGAGCRLDRTHERGGQQQRRRRGRRSVRASTHPQTSLCTRASETAATPAARRADPTRSGNGPGSVLAGLLEHAAAGDDRHEAHRQVDEEHPAPPGSIDEEPAERRAEGGSHGAHRPPDGDGDRDSLTWRRPQHEGQRRRRDRRCPHRLQQAGDDRGARRSAPARRPPRRS